MANLRISSPRCYNERMPDRGPQSCSRQRRADGVLCRCWGLLPSMDWTHEALWYSAVSIRALRKPKQRECQSHDVAPVSGGKRRKRNGVEACLSACMSPTQTRPGTITTSEPRLSTWLQHQPANSPADGCRGTPYISLNTKDEAETITASTAPGPAAIVIDTCTMCFRATAALVCATITTLSPLIRPLHACTYTHSTSLAWPVFFAILAPSWRFTAQLCMFQETVPSALLACDWTLPGLPLSKCFPAKGSQSLAARESGQAAKQLGGGELRESDREQGACERFWLARGAKEMPKTAVGCRLGRPINADVRPSSSFGGRFPSPALPMWLV
ncbi:hypothetical protein V8C26DRAFT_336802 [Trichoderma gracile]